MQRDCAVAAVAIGKLKLPIKSETANNNTVSAITLLISNRFFIIFLYLSLPLIIVKCSGDNDKAYA